MEKENHPLWSNRKFFYSSFGITTILLFFLFILSYNLGVVLGFVFLLLFTSVLLHIRWLMRISSYEMDVRQRTQDEALKTAMAANMTMIMR